MKNFKITHPYLFYDLELLDKLLDSMSKQGYRLTKVRSFGRLYFEYDPHKSYSYYSFYGVNNMFGNKPLTFLNSDVKRLFGATEILSIGTSLKVYELGKSSPKDRFFLNKVASSYGYDKFDAVEILSIMRKKRNFLLFKNIRFLSIAFAIITVLFIIASFATTPYVSVLAIICGYFAVNYGVKAYKLL